MSRPVSRRELFGRKPAPATPTTRSMPTSPQTPTTDTAGQPPLPELVDQLVDADTVDALLRDIAACTRLVEIVPKHAARGYVGDRTVTLEAARRMIHQRAVRSIQLRYRYEGAEWWDTLVVTAVGVRLVRIRHDLSDFK